MGWGTWLPLCWELPMQLITALKWLKSQFVSFRYCPWKDCHLYLYKVPLQKKIYRILETPHSKKRVSFFILRLLKHLLKRGQVQAREQPAGFRKSNATNKLLQTGLMRTNKCFLIGVLVQMKVTAFPLRQRKNNQTPRDFIRPHAWNNTLGETCFQAAH